MNPASSQIPAGFCFRLVSLLCLLLGLGYVVYCIFNCQAIAAQLSPELRLPAAPLAPESAPIKPRAGSGFDQKGKPQWLALEPGLEFCELRASDSDAKIAVLRIDPDYFDFSLGAVGKDGDKPRTLSEWVTEKGFSAAINASMYLPDNRTSTGYMRSGDFINNGRIMDRFGAFFVAGPKRPDLPRAAIVDRDDPDWRTRIAEYETVIQNYRMINSQRRILWYPGGPYYSISAVAQDGKGRILFLHSRMPAEAYSFVQQLLHLPLDIRSVMYVEGGAQAGLVVNSGGLKRELTSPHAPSLLITGNLKAVLPNVIGIRPVSSQREIFKGVQNPVN